MAGPAADVFLSYKAEDRARLVPLVRALEGEGLTVWWDVHIGAGTNWHEDIEAHLETARCVLVAWSRRSAGPAGQFVRDEARRAQRRGAYLPVRIDPVEPPLGFGEIQALSLTGWKGDASDPRFKAVADAVRSQIKGEHGSRPHVGLPAPGLSRRAIAAGGATVAVAAAAGGWFLLRPAPANARRIAVLPFANLSGAPDQTYFAEGIAEELRSALTHMGLQVMGRGSSEAVKDLDAKAAASKLGVANLLTGSVRRSPEVVRISAQLVGGGDGVERWAQTYDRAPGDEIRIQADIATNVAQAMSIELGQAGHAALALGGTADSAAQDLFLRATALYMNDTSEAAVRQALGLLDAAIARDPAYANAFRLKARALELLATSFTKSTTEMASQLAQAEGAARRAIAIAPKLGPAYAELAVIQEDRFNFVDALRYIDQALGLSPDDPLVLPNAMYITRYLGDPHSALRLADRLIELDPLEAVNYSRRADVLMTLRQFPQAIEWARKSLQLAPDRSWPHQLIGDALSLMGRPDEARAEYRNVPADDIFRMVGEAIVEARARNIGAMERSLEHMRGLFGDTASYNYAQVYAQARDGDRAFASLAKGLEVKDAGMGGLRTDPFMDPIRQDPRYADLLKRLNFPASA
jgi:serine/threonine-protein kinase